MHKTELHAYAVLSHIVQPPLTLTQKTYNDRNCFSLAVHRKRKVLKCICTWMKIFLPQIVLL